MTRICVVRSAELPAARRAHCRPATGIGDRRVERGARVRQPLQAGIVEVGQSSGEIQQ